MSTRDVLTLCAAVAMGFVIGWFSRERMGKGPATFGNQDAQIAQKTPATAETSTAAATESPPAVEAPPAALRPADTAPAADANKPTTPQKLQDPAVEELPKLVKDKLPNTAFALTNTAIDGNVDKAKVAIIVYSDFQ